MASRTRVISVTLKLAALGAVGGAICGAIIPIGVMVATGYPEEILMPGTGRLMALGAAFGAVTGAVMGPAVAWGLLRRVPLGKAIAWGAFGTVAGALVGQALAPLKPYGQSMPGLMIGAGLGLVAACVALRLADRRSHDLAATAARPNE